MPSSMLKTKKTLKRLKNLRYLLAPKRSVPATKFVILYLPRSGSTLLVDLLNTQPTIHCNREVFGIRTFFPAAYVKALSIKSQQRVYGFKVSPWQLSTVQRMAAPRTFITDLHNEGWKVIYLKRENTLQAAVSEAVARQKVRLLGSKNRQAFQRRASEKPLPIGKIKLDTNELFKLLTFRERDLAQADEMLRGIPHLSLIYEKHLLEESQQQNTIDRVCMFLNLHSVPGRTQLVKVGKSIKDTVSNYDELVQAIVATKYSAMLSAETNTVKQVA